MTTAPPAPAPAAAPDTPVPVVPPADETRGSVPQVVSAGGEAVAVGTPPDVRSIYDDPGFRPAADLPDDDEAIDEFFSDDDDDSPGLDPRVRSAIEWAAVIIGALVVALVIKTFLFQAFYIPSESMTPTLNENDRILVYKLDTSPQRGDLMVFERPPNAPTNDVNELIKRTIALEGETIAIRDNTLFIDDQRLIEPYIGTEVVSAGRVWSSGCANPQGDGSACEVPPDHVFMMGDNRSNSVDSRSFGPVSTDLMVGRAVLRVWPLGAFGRL